MRAGGGGRDLLAEHHPHRLARLRRPCGALGGRAPGHRRRQRRVVGQRLVDGLRVGVEVEEPAAAGDGGRHVAQVVEVELARHVVGVGRSDTTPGAVRRPQRSGGRRRRGAPPPRGSAVAARCPKRLSGSNGRRKGRRNASPPVAEHDRRRALARFRSSVGAGDEDLEHGVVELPHAREGRSRRRGSRQPRPVVSMRSRAVWARWARARASGRRRPRRRSKPLQLAGAVPEAG